MPPFPVPLPPPLAVKVDFSVVGIVVVVMASKVSVFSARIVLVGVGACAALSLFNCEGVRYPHLSNNEMP